MSLFRLLIESAPKHTQPLSFGIHSNIIITKLEPLKMEKGLPRPNNTYITFSQINTETKAVVKSQEVNWFNLDLSKDKNMTRNQFKEQFSSFVHILEQYGAETDSLESAIIIASGINVDETEDLFDDLLNLVASDKKKSKLVNEVMQNTFAKLLTPFINNTDILLKLKLVCNKKKFIQLPSSVPFLDANDGNSLKISTAEQGLWDAADTAATITADATGKKKIDEEKVANPMANI